MSAFSARLDAEGTRVEPTQLLGEAPEAKPYPIDALGDLAARTTRAIMLRVQVPDAIAAHSVLAAISLGVQGHVLMELPTKERKPPSLFLGTVADSGDRKTTSDSIATAPIRDFEIELNVEYQREKQLHAANMAIWKSEQTELTKVNKGRGAAAVAEAVEALGLPPMEPLRPALTVPPGSTQGVIDMLEKGRPSIGLFINEGGSWLGSWGMQDDNRTATISAYSELWDGQPIKTLTKGEGYRFMPNRAFSFHVMFQPVYIQQMFGDEEMRGQGFLSRVLAAAPRSLAGSRLRDVTAIEPEHVEEDIADYHERLSRIIRHRLPTSMEFPQNGLTDRKIVTFSPEATELFWKFYNYIEVMQAPGGTLVGIRGFAGKATEQAARLATVCQIFEGGLRDLVLSGEAMSRGIVLMNFYIDEALRLADQLPTDPKLVDANALSEWLKDGWDETCIALPFIRQFGKGKLRKWSADYARELCAILVRHDHLSPIPAGIDIRAKRCREAWRVNVKR